MDEKAPSLFGGLLRADPPRSGAAGTGVTINYWGADESKIRGEISGITLEGKRNYRSLVAGTFVRGSADDHKIQNLLGPGSFRGSIFTHTDPKSKKKNSFLLLPVIPNEGDELKKRIGLVVRAISFLLHMGEPTCKVSLLCGTRAAWREQSSITDRYSREIEILRFNVGLRLDKSQACNVQFLKDNPVDEYKFEIEKSVRTANIIVPYDGSAGNLLVRCFHWLSDQFELLSIPWFGPNDGDFVPVGEGGFKAEPDLTPHVQAAAVWARRREEAGRKNV